MKICTKCKIEKKEKEFYKDKRSTDNLYPHCKKCHYIKTEIYRKTDKSIAQRRKHQTSEEYKEYRRKYKKEYLKNPLHRKKENERMKEYRKTSANKNTVLKRLYGISFEEYSKLLLKQNYKCAICDIDEVEYGKKLVVDHNHKTGKVRGLLCRNCNVGIGLLQDNKELLKKASLYV